MLLPRKAQTSSRRTSPSSATVDSLRGNFAARHTEVLARHSAKASFVKWKTHFESAYVPRVDAVTQPYPISHGINSKIFSLFLRLVFSLPSAQTSAGFPIAISTGMRHSDCTRERVPEREGDVGDGSISGNVTTRFIGLRLLPLPLIFNGDDYENGNSSN